MKKRLFNFLVAAIFTIVPAGLADAADVPDNALHWYRVVITTGAHTETLTGTSLVPPPELAQRVAKGEAIELQNLRDDFLDPNEPKPVTKWRKIEEGSALFLQAKTVLYFLTLPGDPLKEK